MLVWFVLVCMACVGVHGLCLCAWFVFVCMVCKSDVQDAGTRLCGNVYGCLGVCVCVYVYMSM